MNLNCMKENFTRLTLEQSNKKIVYEFPSEDVSGDDLVQALYTIMIGMTFTPESVIHTFAGFIEEYGHNLYDVYEHYEENEGEKDEE